MQKKLMRIGLTALAACACSWMKAEAGQPPVKLSWKEIDPLPSASGRSVQPGVARAFSGMAAGRLIVAGGANFPDAALADGGAKRYQDAVFAFDPETGRWSQVGSLRAPLGEGGAVTTSKGVFCVGGSNGSAALADAFFLSLNAQGELTITEVEPLPVSVTMPAVAAYKDQVFVACGSQNGEPSRRVWVYSIAANAWSKLGEIPGPARVQAVAAAQNADKKCTMLFIFGGSGKGADGVETALADGYGVALPVKPGEEPVWKTCAPPVVGGEAFSTIGAGFAPSGNQHILLVGGFNAALWNSVNRAPPADQAAYLNQDPAAFGWNREVLAYHAVTDTWCRYGSLPEAMQPRCGAAVEMFTQKTGPLTREQRLIVAGGEIKPGVRTPAASVAAFERVKRFSPWSWSVIAGYFLLMAAMAAYFLRREKTADSYFRGGGKIPWYVAGMSIFATMLSSITFISIPTMTYLSDWRYFPMVFCILGLAPIVIVFYLPFFCRLKITSAYEYLEKRFNVTIRLFGSAAFNIFMVCRVAVVTLLPAIALNAVTGINVNLCLVMCGVATIVYCSVGGVEAVVWSDFVQGIILLGGAVLVLALLVAGTEGGLGGFFATASESGKLRMWDFRLVFNQPVFWVVMIQGVISNLSSYTSDQCVVQRYITTTDERQAARSIWFNGVLSVLASVVFYMIGTALYTHYKSYPALMDAAMPESDSVFPIYMAMELHPVIAGLVIAAIFAATISTLSANLNSSATAVTTDFLMRFNPKIAADPRRQVFCGRVCTITVGVLGTIAAIMLAQMESRSLFDEFQKFIAMLTAGLTCLFFMGIFIPRIGGLPAAVGLIANYVVCYGLDSFASAAWKPHPFTYGGIGLAVCLAVSYLLSFVFPRDAKDLKGLTLKTIDR